MAGDLLPPDIFEVKLASSGKIHRIEAGRCIADVLLEAGVKLDVACMQGICGTCLTPVLAGEPDHRDSFLNEAEHAANDLMALCCSRSKTALLVLDL